MTSDSGANPSDLAGWAVQGSVYSIAASGVTLTLGFARSVLLARLLLPEHFGVATLALFFLNLTASLRNFGIDDAVIHRQDAGDRFLRTYFTLRMGLAVGGLGLLALATPLVADLYPSMPQLGAVLFGFIGVAALKSVTGVQMTVLSKNLAFRHLALTDVASSVTMTIVAPLMAWQGWGIWSLVAEQFSGVLVRFMSIWVVHRAWRPGFAWDPDVARWFWRFGVRVWIGNNLTFLLDRIDDFWVGTVLGKTPLGFYSRAYEFARYPRRAIANPILSVFFPTFARLQSDPVRLAKAFFRVASLMVRVGFWFSLVLILAAPEFVGVLLGRRWLPMVPTFQLMIVYTLLDPLAMAASNLLMAVGQPDLIARTRAVQLVVFVPALIALAYLAGIEGVAVAADVMVAIGAVLLFAYTRRFVDYSMRALWGWPLVAFLVSAGAVIASAGFWSELPAWQSLVGKAGLITVAYWTMLWLAERHQLRTGWDLVWALLRPRLREA